METDIKNNFGRRVKQLRKSKELSQKELSEKIQINRSYLSGIERGEKNSTLTNVAKIANGLEVPVALLFIDTSEIKDELEKKLENTGELSPITSSLANFVGMGNILGSNMTSYMLIQRIRNSLEPLIEEKIKSALQKEEKE